MAFEQAGIPVQKTEEFDQLRAAIDRVFAAECIEKLLGRIQGSGVRVREFEGALEKRVFEAVDPALARSGRSAQQLYSVLTLSDQALMREFYLERVEKVEAGVRQRFQKAYRYY